MERDKRLLFIKVNPFECLELVRMCAGKSGNIEQFVAGVFLPENIMHAKGGHFKYHKKMYRRLRRKYGNRSFIVYIGGIVPLERATIIEEVAHYMLWIADPTHAINNPYVEHAVAKHLAEVIDGLLNNN
jgi:hypothetical protein